MAINLSAFRISYKFIVAMSIIASATYLMLTRVIDSAGYVTLMITVCTSYLVANVAQKKLLSTTTPVATKTSTAQ